MGSSCQLALFGRAIALPRHVFLRFENERRKIELRNCVISNVSGTSFWLLRGRCDGGKARPTACSIRLARQHGDFVTSQSSRLSQGQQGRARHPVRAADSNPFAERRARSDAPYLTLVGHLPAFYFRRNHFLPYLFTTQRMA